jgi:hypothetical protein
MTIICGIRTVTGISARSSAHVTPAQASSKTKIKMAEITVLISAPPLPYNIPQFFPAIQKFTFGCKKIGYPVATTRHLVALFFTFNLYTPPANVLSFIE